MSAAYSPSPAFDLSVRKCACNRPTQSVDGVCPSCWSHRLHKRMEAHRKTLDEVHASLARSSVSRRFLIAAGMVKGGAR